MVATFVISIAFNLTDILYAIAVFDLVAIDYAQVDSSYLL